LLDVCGKHCRWNREVDDGIRAGLVRLVEHLALLAKNDNGGAEMTLCAAV